MSNRKQLEELQKELLERQIKKEREDTGCEGDKCVFQQYFEIDQEILDAEQERSKMMDQFRAKFAELAAKKSRVQKYLQDNAKPIPKKSDEFNDMKTTQYLLDTSHEQTKLWRQMAEDAQKQALEAERNAQFYKKGIEDLKNEVSAVKDAMHEHSKKLFSDFTELEKKNLKEIEEKDQEIEELKGLLALKGPM